MSPPSSVDEAISELKSVAERTDQNVLQDVQERTKDGRQVLGFTPLHGDHELIVLGAEEREACQIQYDYDFSQQFAHQRLAEDLPDGENIEVDPEVFEREVELARNDLKSVFEEFSPEEVDQYYSSLQELLSDPSVQYEISNIGMKNAIGFTLTRKIFPYRESFSLRDYHRGSQAVISVGLPAMNYIQRSFNLQPGDLDSSSSDGEEDTDAGTSRGFY